MVLFDWAFLVTAIFFLAAIRKCESIGIRVLLLIFSLYSLLPGISTLNYLMADDRVRDYHNMTVLVTGIFLLLLTLVYQLSVSSRNGNVLVYQKVQRYYPVIPLMLLPFLLLPLLIECSKSSLLQFLPNQTIPFLGAIVALILVDYFQTGKYKMNLSIATAVFVSLSLCGSRNIVSPLLVSIIIFCFFLPLKETTHSRLYALISISVAIGYAMYRVGHMSTVEDALASLLHTGFGEFFMTRGSLDAASRGGDPTGYTVDALTRLVPFSGQMYDLFNFDAHANAGLGLDFGLGGNFFGDSYYFSRDYSEYIILSILNMLFLFVLVQYSGSNRWLYSFAVGFSALLPNIFRSGSLIIFSYVKVYIGLFLCLTLMYFVFRAFFESCARIKFSRG